MKISKFKATPVAMHDQPLLTAQGSTSHTEYER
ncbi:MAG: hypothetical protein CM1200mP39_00250 [Dehalococcoidia bacterium]|nr:MAG: hypothetical protein CM1200mP39_00250 [Dehalococcoidia bacterium]